MSTLVFTHPAGLGHDTGPGHPEHPGRLAAVLRALEGLGEGVDFVAAPAAGAADARTVHDAAMVADVLAAIPATSQPVRGAGPDYGFVDHETVVSAGSREAVFRAIGAARAAVDAVAGDDGMGGGARAAFCAMRPPGHHAMRDRAMGFCLFNAVAIAAVHARAAHGLARVAVLDFDVHHGNGTEDILRDRAGFFYGSSHEYPNYPGTGTASPEGPCTIVNVPLPPGTAGPGFRRAWSDRILPALDAFRPELVLISAGFDGHRKDPLSMMELDTGDYAWVTTEIRAVAGRHAEGRIVSYLEGGYDIDALAASARAHVEALAGG